jgi:hypothetical protein
MKLQGTISDENGFNVHAFPAPKAEIYMHGGIKASCSSKRILHAPYKQ